MDEPGQRMGEGALNAAGAVRPGGVTPAQVRGGGQRMARGVGCSRSRLSTGEGGAEASQLELCALPAFPSAPPRCPLHPPLLADAGRRLI